MKRDRIAVFLLYVIMLIGIGCGQKTQSAAPEGSRDSKETISDRAPVATPEKKNKSTALQGSAKLEDAVADTAEQSPQKTSGADESAATRLGKAFQAAGIAANRVSRKNHLKEIQLAMFNFMTAHGGFLPADYKGIVSWRVLLLDDLDHSELRRRMHLNEPWNSEHNRQFLSQMPDVYDNLGDAKAGKTSLHAFVGIGAPFSRPDGKPPKFEDFAGRSDRTIFIIEAGPDKAVEWTKPGGLEFDPKNPKAALGNVPDVFYALMMDGSIRELTKDISNEQLLELITGGKPPADGKQ